MTFRARSSTTDRWLLGLAGILAAIPWRLLCWLGWRLGDPSARQVARLVVTVCFGWLRPRRLSNLQRVLGPLAGSGARCRAVNRAAVEHLARLLVDLWRLRRIPVSQAGEAIVFTGEEHLRTALQHGKGVLLIGNHMGSFPRLYSALAARGYRLNLVVNRLRLRCVDEHFDQAARRFGVRLVRVGSGANREANEAFKRNQLFCTMLDVSIRRNREVWLPFGCGALNVDRGIAELALRHREVPVLLATVRNDDAHHVTVTLEPAPSASDAVMLTQRWLDRLFEEVRLRPEQWWAWSFVVLRPATHAMGTASSNADCRQRLGSR